MELYWKITLTLATVSIIMLFLPSFFNIVDDRYTREIDTFLGNNLRNQWYLTLGGVIIVVFFISLLISVILSIWCGS